MAARPGPFYLFLLLLQSCLIFTTAHTNRLWTGALELTVAVHGTLVAVMNSGLGGTWPMFLFGFLAVFVITQMHGFGLSARTRWALAGVYAVAALTVYSGRGIGTIAEIIRIPMAEYLLLAALTLLVWPVALGLRHLQRRPRPEPVDARRE